MLGGAQVSAVMSHFSQQLALLIELSLLGSSVIIQCNKLDHLS